MAYKQNSPQVVVEGGTGLTTITDGGIMLGSGTAAITPTAQPSNGQLLVGSTGADPVLASLTSTGSSITVTGGAGTLNIDLAAPVSVANGGTGAITLTDFGVLVGSGVAAVTALAVGTDGQVLVGDTAADPVFATISSSDSLLTLTGGAGTLDIVAQNAVSAAAALTDNLVARGDGGARGVQTSTMSITDAGEMTNASQPAFLAYQGTTDANETGDATVFSYGDTDVGTTLTEIYDQNSDFVPGASGGATFTSPVTGRYLLTLNTFINGGTAITEYEMRFRTSNRLYRQRNNFDAAAAVLTISQSMSVIADMDAADTCTFEVYTVDTGGKIDDIFGAGEFWNLMSGALIC